MPNNKSWIKIGFYLTVISLLVSSCSRTIIRTDKSNLDIYLDDKYVGTGTADVPSVGPPHTAKLEARKGERVVGSSTMKRRFTWKTVLLGAISYYSGFYWAWYYPENATIYTKDEDVKAKKTISNWDDPSQSIWMQPLIRK